MSGAEKDASVLSVEEDQTIMPPRELDWQVTNDDSGASSLLISAKAQRRSHPDDAPVTIDFFAPLYDFEHSRLRSLQVEVWIAGCVAGVEYRAFVEELKADDDGWTRQRLDQSFSLASADSFHFKAVFPNPGVRSSHRFIVWLSDLFPGLEGEEHRILSKREITFHGPFRKKTGSIEIKSSARNAPVFDALRSRQFGDPLLRRGPSLDMAQTCRENPLRYLKSVFHDHQPAKRSGPQCIITGFDESHEEEGMLMIFSMLAACNRTRFLVYDMGMSQHALQVLSIKFRIEVYEPPPQMPGYALRFERGNKAFKPIVIADAVVSKGCARGFWGDSSVRHVSLCQDGSLPLKPLSLHWGGHDGVNALTGPNQEYTHPGTYEYFLTERSDNEHIQWESGLILFDMSIPLWRGVLCRFLYCALHKPCILPHDAMVHKRQDMLVDGIMYRAHRDDQSVLNLALLDAVRESGSDYNVTQLNDFVTVERDVTITEDQKARLVAYLMSSSRPPPGSAAENGAGTETLEAQFDLPNRFVVLSASVQEVVDQTPYSLLLPLSARSWAAAGFRPIVVLASHQPAQWRASALGALVVEEVENIPGSMLFVLPSPTRFLEVSLAQLVRLFVSFLLPDSELHSYVRVSDADMIIYQGWPFRTEAVAGVHIYNGDCCLPELPMHSIGMAVNLWRRLFASVLSLPSIPCSPEAMSTSLSRWLAEQGVDGSSRVAKVWEERHKGWSLDQILAGQIIGNITTLDIPLTLAPLLDRVHFANDPLTRDVVESHEYRIQLSQLLNLQQRINTSVLRDNPIFQHWSWTAWFNKVATALEDSGTNDRDGRLLSATLQDGSKSSSSSPFPVSLAQVRGLRATFITLNSSLGSGDGIAHGDIHGRNRSPSFPLISGDGFRHLCALKCEDPGCNFEPEDVEEGDCIYLAAGDARYLRAYRDMSEQIHKRHVVVTHNGDMSSPDGDDWHKNREGWQLSSMEYPEEFSSLLDLPLLVGWFASNCHWKGNRPKPAKLHCIPLGIENRYLDPIGSAPEVYFEWMERRHTVQPTRMLLVAFRNHLEKPLRFAAVEALQAKDWITVVEHSVHEPGPLTRESYLRELQDHHFAACPPGHGFDTHRLYEVLMAGIYPIVISGHMDSMYEDLPILVVKRWTDVTKELLEATRKQFQSRARWRTEKMFFPYWQRLILEAVTKPAIDKEAARA